MDATPATASTASTSHTIQHSAFHLVTPGPKKTICGRSASTLQARGTAHPTNPPSTPSCGQDNAAGSQPINASNTIPTRCAPQCQLRKHVRISDNAEQKQKTH
ncbi:hypothetical protein TcCL_NonESM06682 [Trypanosoma cruzi]|nr:hypothetical protein TcCL_NonESM06682 [Trypanosoma cruzi]